MDKIYNGRFKGYSKETREGQRKNLLNGGWASKPPKGYSWTKDEKGRGLIVPNEISKKIVFLFQEFATGTYTVEQLSMISNRSIPFWSVKEIEKVLSDIVYTGIVKVPNDDGTYEFVQGKHEPIISKELYEKAQEVLKKQPKYEPLLYKDLKKDDDELF